MGLLDIFRRRPAVEAKASEMGPIISMGRTGQAQWTQRDLRQYAEEGYRKNPVVYRCVLLVAENAASMQIDAYRGKTEIADHPALKVLARPNPFMSGRDLLVAAYAFRLIAGNSFLEAVTVGGSPVELHAHRPERLKPVPGPNGYPAFYEFNLSGVTKRVPIDEKTGVSDILHLKDFNPLDDWYGMSPLDPASYAIDAHTAGAREVKTNLEKGGIPVGGFMYDGAQALTDEQGRQAREMFAETLRESRRTRAPAMLNKFWKWVQFGQGPAELGLAELKADAAREICFTLGVPPMLLGIPGDNTYANYAEANRAFWRETVIPFAEKNLDAIGPWLGALSGTPDLVLKPNTDALPALAEERSTFWTMLNASEFITVNEKREATGYQPVNGGDEVLVASSDIPISDAGAAITGGQEPDPDQQQDAEDEADASEDPSEDDKTA